jgi:hypothetical protein
MTAITLAVKILPPEPSPTNETCGTAQSITVGVPFLAPIIDAVKDLASACPTPLGDLLYSFTLPVTSDVDIYANSLDGDGLPAISLRGPGCALLGDELACQSAVSAHIFRHSLPAGTYDVAVSASAPTIALVTVEARAPTPADADETCSGAPLIAPNETISVSMAAHQDDINLGCFPGAVDAAYLVPFADACADALAIPETGGFFQGNTANNTADFTAGCDQNNGPPGGAPDQLLEIVLSARKRVVLEMAGSSYATLLDVRQGPDCPGSEVPLGCTVGSGPSRSYLDLTLDAGTYYIQVDGFAGEAGAWSLDVRVVEP